MTEEKFPCLYGLKDDCSARKYVEESDESTDAKLTNAEKKVKEALEKATRTLQFDDRETAKELGKAMMEGAFGKSGQMLVQSMKPPKAVVMRDYCGMCPHLLRERTKIAQTRE